MQPFFRDLVTIVLMATASLVFSLAPADANENDLLGAFSALEGHLDGSSPLSGNQIAAQKQIIDANSNIFGNSSSTIGASFNLVQTYEQEYGPMWSDGSPTENGYSRRDTTDQDIHWTMFHVMQNIVDDTYNSNNIGNHQSLLSGYKFGSADVVPGPVSPPANPNTSYFVSIDGSFLDTYGRNTMHWAEPDRNARKATGTYLAPGSIATVNF